MSLTSETDLRNINAFTPDGAAPAPLPAGTRRLAVTSHQSILTSPAPVRVRPDANRNAAIMSATLGAVAFFTIMIAHVLAVIAVGRARGDADEVRR